ncbi:MAG: RNA polymerase sporulation sigma factor SigH [Chloroflexota bacterium]
MPKSTTPTVESQGRRKADGLLRDISQALEVAGREGDGNPLPLVPDFAEIILKLRPVLTVAEIAEIASVKERQVHHWAAGKHAPQGVSRKRLLTLFQVISHLETQLSPERIKVWLWSPHAELSEPPAVLLMKGDLDPVLAAAKRLALRDEISDAVLIELARQGNPSAYDALVRRYRGFVRLKASSYYLLGGETDDLDQEGLLGLYKAIRDYRVDRESSFRNFAELCITRQIITAVKAATRNKHMPLNQYVSLSQSPPGSDDESVTLADILSGPAGDNPESQAIASEDLEELLAALSGEISAQDTRVLSLYLDGCNYEAIADQLNSDTETVDMALQRVKLKVVQHL